MIRQREGGGRSVSPLKPGDHTVVIGGGPGGLTAAYLLAKKGHPVTVLEATEALGGISQTVEYKGFRFDIGGHRFFTKIPPVEELWHEILGDEFISVPRLSRIFYDGKFFDYPLKAGNALKGLGFFNAFVIGLSYLKANAFPSPVEENFEQWVSNRFGKRLYEVFFKTYTEKVWGIPCTEIRAEWAAQRIQGLSLAKAITAAVPLTKRGSGIKTLINEFQYPRLGPGQMWEVCADKIRKMGGQIHLGQRVEALEHLDGRVVAVRVASEDGAKRIEGDHFFSTMPLRELVRGLDPRPPDDTVRAGEGLRYRDFLVVALILDEQDVFPDNWIYIHSAGVKVGRIQNFGNWSKAMLANTDQSCVGMEYFCFEGDGLWESSNEDLIALATREISELGLADGGRVRDGHVVRMPKAYPIYDEVYGKHLETIRDFIDPIENLHPVGRNGMHKYNNQDHSMLTAMMSVQNMEGGSYDVWAVNTDYEYHEEIKIPEGPSDEPTGEEVGGPGGIRIGVDASCWANDRGYGRFARELLTEMVRTAPGDDFVFFLDPASERRFDLSAPNLRTVRVAQSKSPTEAAAAKGFRSPADMLRLTLAVRREKLDAFFCPSVYTYFPLPLGLPAVVGIHDAIAERFPSRTLPSWRARLFWKAKVQLAILQSKLVLTASDYSARDISSVIGVPRPKIRVAGEAPAAVFRPSESGEEIRAVSARFGLSQTDSWLIYVGGFSPHKNLDVLVRAYARITQELPGDRIPYLLLVGPLTGDVFHSDIGALRNVIEEAGVKDRVLFTGFVPDEELRHLYSGAIALALPSDAEGFGLPAAEAAACGTAVVATRESPLEDLLEGGGIFLEPRDEEQLSDALLRMVLDEGSREAMANTAIERVGQLSWERSAMEAMSAIREAASEPSRESS